MEFVIITGMSGAGKTGALHVLEDIGYYCVDNLPSSLLSTLYRLCLKSEDDSMKRVAVVVDVRGNEKFEEMCSQIEHFKMHYENVKVLFFDAMTDRLVVRYKETRRRHPLSEKLKDGSVLSAVELERELLLPIKRTADYNIDTTYMSNKQLRERIMSMFMEDTSQSITLTFMSFGFKYGIPQDADLVFDVRFLPNPYYIDTLKEKTGNDPEVQDYVMQNDKGPIFLEKLKDMVEFLIPNYILEGKNQLVIAIGCTGGKHRSVTLANALYHTLETEESYGVRIEHRDIGKDSITKRK